MLETSNPWDKLSDDARVVFIISHVNLRHSEVYYIIILLKTVGIIDAIDDCMNAILINFLKRDTHQVRLSLTDLVKKKKK